METCLRGFSFMPENAKVDIVDFQYIEGKELEHAWKTTRRQRLKEQEQRIWDEFVQEQDVVKDLYDSDPYQFLHDLDESSLKEMLETELQKMRRTTTESEPCTPVVIDPQEDLSEKEARPALAECPTEARVSFEDHDKEECDMFHIFDDEVSGAEDETMESSSPTSPPAPATVRAAPVACRPDLASNKSSENVANAIENSIYCARVKDLRIRINDELVESINTLEKLEVLSLERESSARVKRRAKEFCSRYQTQKLYPLQRQLADIERVVRHPAPFGKHTHFQALMVRLVSLHQNLLVAFQVLLRNFDQTYWLEESGACVKTLVDFTKKGAELHSPDQDLLVSCDKLTEAFAKYTTHVTNFFYTGSSASTKKSKGRRRHRPANKCTKSVSARGSGAGAAGEGGGGKESSSRLSMYSGDTLRMIGAGAHSSKDRSLCASKTKTMSANGTIAPSPKSSRKSPRVRRPLMRAPGGSASGAGRLRHKDAEVPTLVETIGTCLSSHISPSTSARARTPRSHRSRVPHDRTVSTSRSKVPRLPSPHKNQSLSTNKSKNILKALSSILSDSQDAETINLTSFNATTGEIDIKEQKVDIKDQKMDIKEQKIDKKDCNIDKKVRKNIDNKYKSLDSKGSKKDNGKDGMERAKLPTDLKIDLRLKLDEVDADKGKADGDEVVNVSEAKVENSSRTDRSARSTNVAARCEVTRLLKQLCSVETSGTKNNRVSGVRNAQLVYINGGSPRPPSTPQLLKILEETIQKKVPKSMYKKSPSRNPEKYRLTFNIQEPTANNLFQYRTRFVQHMLASAMYANSAVGKPWEMIGSVSEQLLDEVVMALTKEIQIKDIIQDLYHYEINTD